MSKASIENQELVESSLSDGLGEFDKLARERRSSLFAEFWLFLRDNKKWWLLPILIVLLLPGASVLLGCTAIAPFIYPLF